MSFGAINDNDGKNDDDDNDDNDDENVIDVDDDEAARFNDALAMFVKDAARWSLHTCV